jgi:CRISPR-associated protein Cst2
MSKAIEVVYLTRVEGANLNSAGTEGVISVLKKIEDIDGNEFIRVSGQSVKYQIRQIWDDQGDEQGIGISQVKPKGSGTDKVIVSAGDPIKYIDDDLFGYMIAETGKGARKRTASVRTNGMISIFPYKGDRDFAVRYDPTPAQDHNIYEVELTTNIMRGNFFVELDRLGTFISKEIGEDKVLPTAEKEKRLKLLFDAIFNFFGGAHLSNYFTKAYPELIVVAVLKRKMPIIGDKLSVTGKNADGKYVVDVTRLKEAIDTFNENVDEILIGGFESVIENWVELTGLSTDTTKVMSLKDLKSEIRGKKFY